MDDARYIEIDGVGEVLFERSRWARNLRLTVRPFKGVRVAIPRGSSLNKAIDFARSRRGWIQKQQSRMKIYEQASRELDAATANIDRHAAKKILTERLAILAERHGFSYNRVFIRRQKTRWGSCSAANNISLNIRLITLPEELLDYVLLHELAHTRIKNHRPVFWAEMDRLVGNGREKAARLRRYGAAII
jgi:predicted metal-dependent hydrolase